MKKLLALILALTMVFALAACGDSAKPAASETKTESGGDAITLRLASSLAEDHVSSRACTYFSDLVKEKSNGRITIEVYHNSQLGDEKSTIEQVQFGGLDFTRISVLPLAEYVGEINALALPYLFKNADHRWTALDGEVGEYLSQKLEEKGFYVAFFEDAGSRSFYNFVREIRTPEDLKGLKIRVSESEAMINLINTLGGVATPMAFNDVYSALQTKVIDGAENNMPSYMDMSHYEVAPFFTYDEHTATPDIVIASKATLDKLSAEDRELILQCGKEAGLWQRNEWNSAVEDANKRAIEAGCTVTVLDSLDAWQSAVAPLYENLNPDVAKLVEMIQNVG